MKVKEESEKVGLKLSIQKAKIMASGTITSWQVDKETVKTVTEFILWGSKSLKMVTSAMKLRHLLLGGKVMTNPGSMLKSRDITLPIKFSLVRAMVFPGVMYGCESWTIKKAELRRIDAFELWHWRWLFRVSWTARKSNQSILKEISLRTDAEAETPILWPLDAKNWLIGKDPDVGKDWRWEEKGTTEDEMVGWHQWLNGRELE